MIECDGPEAKKKEMKKDSKKNQVKEKLKKEIDVECEFDLNEVNLKEKID